MIVLTLISDKHLRQIYAARFESMGWQPVAVSTVEEAEKELEKREIDVVVTDTLLPVATELPTILLLDEITQEDIKTSNAFKVRKTLLKKNTSLSSLVKMIRSLV
ncbi:MAG: hypothetical protein AAB431_00205 [Patescibacteria group bacterium]